jgi:hypothetical protein
MALSSKLPRQAHADFLAAKAIVDDEKDATSPDYHNQSKLAIKLLTYSGLTNARLQLSTHPKINPLIKDPLMKSRAANLRKAVTYHGATQALLSQMEEKTTLDEMIVRIDGLGCRAKKMEVAGLEGRSVHQRQLVEVMRDLELVRVDLMKLLEEKLDVQDLVTRVEEQIWVLQHQLVEKTQIAEPQSGEPESQSVELPTVEPQMGAT